VFPIMRRLHPRGAASRGIVVDATGAMLGPNCVLVRRTPEGYRCLDRSAAAAVQELLLAKDDPDWLFRQCRHIAATLAEDNLPLAQIHALYIPIGDLDEQDLQRLAPLAPLIKANFNPDEPRDWHGRWTSEGGGEPDKPPPDDRPHHGRAGSLAGTLAAASEATAGSLLGDLSAETLSALTRFAARFNAATAALGLLFIPANRRPITDGTIAGRPDLAYSYDADTGILRLTCDAGAGGRRLLFDRASPSYARLRPKRTLPGAPSGRCIIRSRSPGCRAGWKSNSTACASTAAAKRTARCSKLRGQDFSISWMGLVAGKYGLPAVWRRLRSK
jgi:hypothetical protein